jgi:hypothetical protein
MPNSSAAYCTDSTKISLTSATTTVTAISSAPAIADGPEALVLVGAPVRHAGEFRLVRAQRERQPKCIGNQQQDRLEAGGSPVVFLRAVLQLAEQQRHAQHE